MPMIYLGRVLGMNTASFVTSVRSGGVLCCRKNVKWLETLGTFEDGDRRAVTDAKYQESGDCAWSRATSRSSDTDLPLQLLAPASPPILGSICGWDLRHGCED